MYEKKTQLSNKNDEESKKKLEEVELKMAERYSKDMYKKIHEGMNSEDGGWNSGYLWKLRNKLHPRPVDPPTAMENVDGVLLTDSIEIEKEALNHFNRLFEDLPMHEDYWEVKTEKGKILKLRLKQCAKNKTEPWAMDDMELALKSLKNGTSRDPFGYPNELFKSNVAGKDLKEATLKLMNKIKEKQKVPKAIQLCNIAPIYKNKGKHSNFNSCRGIFRLTVLRSILDRLIYNDMYDTMDYNLSDCNVGNRKGRNIRDNLFVLNAVLNSTKRRSEESVDIAVYDVKKCFDTMWASEALNDAYELGFDNDKLPLVQMANKSASIVIKSTRRISERSTIKESHHAGHCVGGDAVHLHIGQAGETCLYK